MNIQVLKHSVKVNGEKIRCAYRKGPVTGLPADTITIYAKDYGDRFPDELCPEENRTDMSSDYFEKSRARIVPTHPLYNDFLKHAK